MTKCVMSQNQLDVFAQAALVRGSKAHQDHFQRLRDADGRQLPGAFLGHGLRSLGGWLGFAGDLARASLVKVRQQALHCCDARVQRVPALDLCNRVIWDAACLRRFLYLRRVAGVKMRQKCVED